MLPPLKAPRAESRDDDDDDDDDITHIYIYIYIYILFTNTDMTFHLIVKFANHGTKEVCFNSEIALDGINNKG